MVTHYLEARDLLEIVESRHQVASTIFCSQFDTPGWYEKIGEDTLADAILDRIIHDSYNIFIDGERSMRERKGKAMLSNLSEVALKYDIAGSISWL